MCPEVLVCSVMNAFSLKSDYGVMEVTRLAILFRTLSSTTSTVIVYNTQVITLLPGISFSTSCHRSIRMSNNVTMPDWNLSAGVMKGKPPSLNFSMTWITICRISRRHKLDERLKSRTRWRKHLGATVVCTPYTIKFTFYTDRMNHETGYPTFSSTTRFDMAQSWLSARPFSIHRSPVTGPHACPRSG